VSGELCQPNLVAQKPSNCRRPQPPIKIGILLWLVALWTIFLIFSPWPCITYSVAWLMLYMPFVHRIACLHFVYPCLPDSQSPSAHEVCHHTPGPSCSVSLLLLLHLVLQCSSSDAGAVDLTFLCFRARLLPQTYIYQCRV